MRLLSKRTLGAALALACVSLVGTSCGGSMGLRELRGGVEMAVKRGSAWTTLTVNPPYLIGARTNLTLKNGVFSGSIEGHGVRLIAEADGVHGMGPFGPVAIEIAEGEKEMLIEGTWNGSLVRFRITADIFEGTIIVGGSGTTRLNFADSCQYTLTGVADDGSRYGTSICRGLPEDTRLVVPGKIRDWFTRAELAVALLTLLSSPPVTWLESN